MVLSSTWGFQRFVALKTQLCDLYRNLGASGVEARVERGHVHRLLLDESAIGHVGVGPRKQSGRGVREFCLEACGTRVVVSQLQAIL